MFAEVKIINH